MAASTVNIADFRCRGVDRVWRRIEMENGPKLVEQPAQDAAHEMEAGAAEKPVVFDISLARESQRMRQRMVFHSVSGSRHRSNLVRFNEPEVAVMRIRSRAMESWSHGSDDCDPPSAA